MLGVLQHLELFTSKKQADIKKLYLRYFVSEFSDKYKLMTVNSSTSEVLQRDSSAILR